MAHIDVHQLQPIFEHVAETIRPSEPGVDCPISTAVYWAMRIDGEVGNGGIAQLIWNLHDTYNPTVLTAALRTIGADAAADLVQRGFDYVSETPTRKQRFFAKGPFGPAKPLIRLTERYDDLVPSVPSLLGQFVIEHWDTPSFQAVLATAGVGDLRQSEVSEEAIWSAIDSCDIDALLGFIDAGLDPNFRDPHDNSLIDRMLGRNDKIPARADAIGRLIDAGADPEALDDHGHTAITDSVFYGGQPEYLRCLVDHDVDIEHAGNFGRTAVFGTTKHLGSLEVMVQAGAVLDHVADDGTTPLGFAVGEYGGRFDDTDRDDRRERVAEIMRSLDYLMSCDAPLSAQTVTVLRSRSRHTELSPVVGDAALLERLVALPSFATTPDANGGGGAWTALHAASLRGELVSIGVLLDAGVAVDAALAESDLDRAVAAGTTPLDVAADAATSELLAERGASAGVRVIHDVYVTARGNQPDKLAELFVSQAGLDAEDAAATVANLPPEEGKRVDWDEDDNVVLYTPALLATFESAEEAAAVVQQVTVLGAAVVVL